MKAIETSGRQVLGHERVVRLWLFAVAALIFAMVVVGGATRLTESGLSITEWQPVTGVLPPLNDAQWQVEFDKYQAIPQFQQLNAHMGLGAFKTIYWWEWTHRLIGRLIGVVFFAPFIFFLWRGWIPPRRRAGLWAILALGGLQGAIGWWMVASGLANRVEVSQYRLATHLVLAALIYVAVLWTASRWSEARALPRLDTTDRVDGWMLVRGGAIGLLVLVLVQIYLGALVAGLRAGYAYNTWPLIDGSLVPRSSRLFFDLPLWRNFFENPLTVQFDHRMLAYAIWLLALLHLLNVVRLSKSAPVLAGAAGIVIAVTVQAALGIWTLVDVVPLPLALLHQAMAMVTLTIVVIHAARVVPRDAVSVRVAAVSP
jgi:heme a synthase